MKPSGNSYSRRSQRAGLTLVELMFALAISGLVLAATHQLVIGTGRIMFDSTNKLLISKDVRTFTNEISRSGRSARKVLLYRSTSNLEERMSNQSGDLLVLVWAEPESIEDAREGQLQRFFITRLVAYAREVDDGESAGPVIRYEREYALPNAAENIEGLDSSKVEYENLVALLLNNSEGATTSRRVLQLSRGLADQRLFFNSSLGDSIIVNGEIYHGNDHRRVTNTYNFTITPRG